LQETYSYLSVTLSHLWICGSSHGWPPDSHHPRNCQTEKSFNNMISFSAEVLITPLEAGEGPRLSPATHLG
jgi:hypothetical protein